MAKIHEVGEKEPTDFEKMYNSIKTDDISCVHSAYKACTPNDCKRNCQCSICRENRKHFENHGTILGKHYTIDED